MDSNRDTRSQIIDLISEELGILAEVVFDEVLEELGINGAELSRYHAGKFIRVLDKKLPADTNNRKKLVRDIGQLLINSR